MEASKPQTAAPERKVEAVQGLTHHNSVKEAATAERSRPLKKPIPTPRYTVNGHLSFTEWCKELERKRETDRQKERETHTETDREAERERKVRD